MESRSRGVVRLSQYRFEGVLLGTVARMPRIHKLVNTQYWENGKRRAYQAIHYPFSIPGIRGKMGKWENGKMGKSGAHTGRSATTTTD